MPTATNVLKISPDGQFIITAGTYKPRIRCFDVTNLSMKWERFQDSDIIDLEIISPNWEKLALLRDDRTIHFHSADGRFHDLRIPKYGRKIKYNHYNSELYSIGLGNEVNRFSLESGQFLEPFTCQPPNTDLNGITINREHGLVITGSKLGMIEC